MLIYAGENNRVRSAFSIEIFSRGLTILPFYRNQIIILTH